MHRIVPHLNVKHIIKVFCHHSLTAALWITLVVGRMNHKFPSLISKYLKPIAIFRARSSSMDASAVGRWSMMAQPGIVEMNHVRGVSNTQSPYFPTFSQHWSLIKPSVDPAMGASGVGRWSVLSTHCTDSSAQHSTVVVIRN